MTNTESDFESSAVRITLAVADRDAMLELMTTLNEQDVAVQTENISRRSLDDSQSSRLDMSELTEKQRETVVIALRSGYYEQPRRSELADLAEELDISKSAVSQRLRGAEAKIIRSTFGKYV